MTDHEKAIREALPVVAWATHHDESMLFPTREEAELHCDDDEEPVALCSARDAEAELQASRERVRVTEADARRYRHMRDLSIEQTGMPGQPCIAMPNGMQSGYYLTEEIADHAVDTSIAAIEASQAERGTK